MSIINSIAQLTSREPFAEGYAREAYYSRKHKVVIKRSKSNRTDGQTKHEIKLWNMMTPEEKTIFPIVEVVNYKGIDHLIMKRCKVVADLLRHHVGSNRVCPRLLREHIVEMLHLDRNALVILEDVVKKYNIGDLHLNNLGVDDHKRLVILDAGYNEEKNGAFSYSNSDNNSDSQCDCSYCWRHRGE